MNYSDLTKEELISRIEELEILNKELLNQKSKEDKLDFSWTGNLGHWYWNVVTNHVTFNELKVNALGYVMEELPEMINYQFFTEKIHPDDYKATMQAMLDHLYGKKNVYETEYRIKTKDGDYKWFYDRGKITEYDKDNKPVFLSGIVFDITDKKNLEIELAQKNKELEERVSIDGLTRLFNHSTIIEYLKKEMVASCIEDRELCIILFDIDNFKRVNDNYGHISGDEVLKDIASIMKSSVRDSDYVGRYGGEEFLVILPKTNIEHAFITAERIRKNIEEYVFISGLKVTISGGLSQYEKEDTIDFINKADTLLYKAKELGKNRVEI